ncbi:MAG: hypothetical protein ACLQAT_17155 [Candidatus Binataceae bacterium]
MNDKKTTIRSRLIVTYTQDGVLHFEAMGSGCTLFHAAEFRASELKATGALDARIRYDGPCDALCGKLLRNANNPFCPECLADFEAQTKRRHLEKWELWERWEDWEP